MWVPPHPNLILRITDVTGYLSAIAAELTTGESPWLDELMYSASHTSTVSDTWSIPAEADGVSVTCAHYFPFMAGENDEGRVGDPEAHAVASTLQTGEILDQVLSLVGLAWDKCVFPFVSATRKLGECLSADSCSADGWYEVAVAIAGAWGSCATETTFTKVVSAFLKVVDLPLIVSSALSAAGDALVGVLDHSHFVKMDLTYSTAECDGSSSAATSYKAFQTVGQELGFVGDECFDAACECVSCSSSDGYLREAGGGSVDAVRVMVPLSDLVDSAGTGIDEEALEYYLALSDCLGKPLLFNVALVLPNYEDAPVDSYPAAWLDLPYVQYELPDYGIGATKVPVLWNVDFLDRYDSVIRALGAATDGDPRIESVLVGYGVWGEFVFDQRAHHPLEDSEYAAARSEWLAEGYSEEAWLSAIEQISESYGAAFSTTPTVAQLTDPGVRIIDDPETYNAEEAENFPELQALLTEAAGRAIAGGVDEIQFNGLYSTTHYGTDYAVYGAIDAVQHLAGVRFEMFLYSGLYTVDECVRDGETSGPISRDGCTDPEQLACAIHRAQLYDADAITFWANEWTEPEAAALIEAYRNGFSPECAYCADGAVAWDGTTLRVSKLFCPADSPPELRGNLPGIDWSNGDAVASDGDYWSYDVGLLPIGSSYELNLTPCETTWEWLSFNEWVPTCGDLGEWVHCKTGEDAGCNVYFYIDGDGDIQPCDDYNCDLEIEWPIIAAPTGVPFEIGLSMLYLRGSSCAEAVGEMPDWSWSSGATAHGSGVDETFLIYLPETSEARRFTYRDCTDTSSWALYTNACEAGAGNGYCFENDDGTYSLKAAVDSDGVITSAGSM